MISPRRGTVAALLALALPLPLLSAASASAATTPAARTATSTRPDKPANSSPQLPVPSGTHTVGKRTLQLTDSRRADPWKPESGPRRLMTSLYYPARQHTGLPGEAPYMTEREARALLKGLHRDHQMPARAVAGTRTHARTGAVPERGRHPLVVLSPGFTMNRNTLSVLAEELASRGYLVAAVDHAYESFGTQFAGRFTDCVACRKTEAGGGKQPISKVPKVRSQDVSFLLDQLQSRYPQLIDGRRIGMAGHSIGGNAAARTMQDDPRVKAGVNLDGTFFAPVPKQGLNGRPFLMLGTDTMHQPGGEDDSWDRDWTRLNGWKRWLTVQDTGHLSFTDMPVLGDQLGVRDPEAPLPGTRSGTITRSYLAAFFDQQLRGITPQPLLNGPTGGNPEVHFHHLSG